MQYGNYTFKVSHELQQRFLIFNKAPNLNENIYQLPLNLHLDLQEGSLAGVIIVGEPPKQKIS